MGRNDVQAAVSYLRPDSGPLRHYLAPDGELNTGAYEERMVTVRDGRAASPPPGLDEEGFVLARHVSSVTDFKDAAQVEAIYLDEMRALVRDLTGADEVRLLGSMLRHAARTGPGVLPPAGDVHLDYGAATATQLARDLAGPEAAYSRFLGINLWRAITEPPQDRPLAVCDARSIGPDEGIANPLIRVDAVPDADTIAREPQPGADAPAGVAFLYNPAHRWVWFPDMRLDEVLAFKLYDSDHNRAWRSAHVAFHDPLCEAVRPRESIEVRAFAYFR